jgi:hypothetical protein
MTKRPSKPARLPTVQPRRSHLHRACADDIRALGWTVAVHNDYVLAGAPMTFWLFTYPRTGRFVKGEGCTDAQALDQVRAAIEAVRSGSS